MFYKENALKTENHHHARSHPLTQGAKTQSELSVFVWFSL